MEFKALTPGQVTEHQDEYRRQIAFNAIRMEAIDGANVEQLTQVAARTDFPPEVRDQAAAQVQEHRAKAARSSTTAGQSAKRANMKAKDVRDVRATALMTLIAECERQYLAASAELEALRDAAADRPEAIIEAERAVALVEIRHGVLVAALTP